MIEICCTLCLYLYVLLRTERLKSLRKMLIKQTLITRNFIIDYA